jgi:uncharacterized protein (DUF2267 family)
MIPKLHSQQHSQQHGIQSLENSLLKTRAWVDRIAQLGSLEPHDAYKALRAVLQTLRDRLPTPESAHLAAQLPTVLRGLYFEGWDPASTPVKMHRAEFLDAVGRRLAPGRFLDPEQLTRQVLKAASEHLSPGELEKARNCLPADLHCLWPEPQTASTDAR